ncbi:MAG: hypothetical protein QME79_10400 [Bacillota bacterium]|nr:hypothetical protein [Bacillota bacterium]
MKPWVAVVGLTVLAVTGLHFSEELQRVVSPPSPAWSRSVRVGETDLNTPVAVETLRGEGYLLAWAAGDSVRFARLAPDGRVLRQGFIEGASPAGEVVGGAGSGAFFWVSPGGAGGAVLDPSGRVVTQYSLPAGTVAVAAAGELHLALAVPDRSGELALWHAVLFPESAPGGVKLDSLGSLTTLGRSLASLQVGFDRTNLYCLTLWQQHKPRVTSLLLATQELATVRRRTPRGRRHRESLRPPRGELSSLHRNAAA